MSLLDKEPVKRAEKSLKNLIKIKCNILEIQQEQQKMQHIL